MYGTMMNHWWWKWLGVIILLYTIVVGMLTPLKPGILSVDPMRIQAGDEAEIHVKAYNSQFDQAATLSAFLRLNDNIFLPSSGIEVKSYSDILVKFTIPHYVPGDDPIAVASLIINNDIDGSAVLPASIFIERDPEANHSEDSPYLSEIIGLISEPGGIRFPYRSILHETIRNTFFHITLWFSMFIMLGTGVFYAVRFLRMGRLDDDLKSKSLTAVSVVYGLLGLLTGSIWARFTWGTWWTGDVKLNMTAVAMLIYLAYFVLRSSVKDQDQEARLASVYNIFAFVALIPLVFVIPRLTDSLHPGSGGNPALGGEDLDHTLRMVFYPAIIGFTLLGFWIVTLYYRTQKLTEKYWLKSSG